MAGIGRSNSNSDIVINLYNRCGIELLDFVECHDKKGAFHGCLIEDNVKFPQNVYELDSILCSSKIPNFFKYARTKLVRLGEIKSEHNVRFFYVLDPSKSDGIHVSSQGQWLKIYSPTQSGTIEDSDFDQLHQWAALEDSGIDLIGFHSFSGKSRQILGIAALKEHYIEDMSKLYELSPQTALKLMLKMQSLPFYLIDSSGKRSHPVVQKVKVDKLFGSFKINLKVKRLVSERIKDIEKVLKEVKEEVTPAEALKIMHRAKL
ncbi:MAG: hypothetical protein P0S95_04440 [Rhabdochlamydiaceae bacterium]|nr:hypothetical protein [Candidatus Amphrikana amoebophyrae]